MTGAAAAGVGAGAEEAAGLAVVLMATLQLGCEASIVVPGAATRKHRPGRYWPRAPLPGYAPPMRWSFGIGRIWGTELKIHGTFLLLLAR